MSCCIYGLYLETTYFRGGAKVALALTEFGGLKKRKSIINYLVFYNDDSTALIRKIA